MKFDWRSRARRDPYRARIVQMTTVPESLAFLRGQAGFFRACGLETIVITSPGVRTVDFAHNEDVRVVSVQMERRISILRDLKSLVRLTTQLARLRPDILHAHTPKAALLGMIAGFAVRVPNRIFHVHGLPVDTAVGWHKRLLSLTDRVTVLLAHRVVFVSPSLRQHALEKNMCQPGKAVVLGHGSANGIDCVQRFNPERYKARRSAIRSDLGLNGEHAIVGFMGRLVIDKGVLDLLDAWSALSVWIPQARLLLVGPAELANGLPKTAMNKVKADPKITWIEWTDEPEKVLSVMDVFVLPSHREGLGLSILEASAMRIAVVASDIPGARDAVLRGTTGILVPPNSPAALGQALRHLLEEPERRRAMGEAGRQMVAERFSPRTVWQELLTLYDSMLGAQHSQATQSAANEAYDGSER